MVDCRLEMLSCLRRLDIFFFFPIYTWKVCIPHGRTQLNGSNPLLYSTLYSAAETPSPLSSFQYLKSLTSKLLLMLLSFEWIPQSSEFNWVLLLSKYCCFQDLWHLMLHLDVCSQDVLYLFYKRPPYESCGDMLERFYFYPPSSNPPQRSEKLGRPC